MKNIKRFNKDINLLVVKIIIIQTYKSVIYSPGIYIFVTIGLGIALIMINNTINLINNGFLLVINEPFGFPLLIFSSLGGIYVSLMAGISITKDREEGYLETLFYGPVSTKDYVWGKSFAYLILFILMLSIYSILCLILSIITGLTITINLIALTFLSVLVSFSLLGLITLISTLFKSTKETIIISLLILLVMTIVQFGENILINIVSNTEHLSLVFIRDFFVTLHDISSWFSPISYYFSAVDALYSNDFLLVGVYIIAHILFGFISNLYASLIMQKKGVLG